MDTSSPASSPPIRVDTRITSQGQVSVPAAIRRKLGVAPGSTLQWTLRGDEVVVKKRASVTFEDVHKELFPNGPPKPISLKQMKEAIAQHARDRYAGR
ncbi:MAG: AbrB/MazE/SpoVT family DNA-binding domain-containing protein [Rhizobacter sp.]|nr:AbrB/MazE/SpoVT family DNA-binding domain-containing protein [Burkholderiales bacterium]